MRARTILAGTLGFGLIIATLGGGWYVLSRMRAKVCPFSGRVIQRQTRAFVSIGGQKYETCCLRCAIVEAQQTGKTLRILKVADFNSGRLLNPGKAWFVEDSTVNLCVRTTPGAESPGRESVYLRGFDRCSPSVMAFSDEQRARAFMAQHGGTLKRLDDLLREVTPASPKVKQP